LRGEYYFNWISTYPRLGSPPLARGVRIENRNTIGKARITPACAGSTVRYHGKIKREKDHPRLRGEYIFHSSLSTSDSGSPPLARGVHNASYVSTGKAGITPACAGSTLHKASKTSGVQDHPRLRGEYASGN